MLKDKTKGNIGDEESKIIDQSINELRMNLASKIIKAIKRRN